VWSFRCYGLDRNGRIIAAENVEASDTDRQSTSGGVLSLCDNLTLRTMPTLIKVWGWKSGKGKISFSRPSKTDLDRATANLTPTFFRRER
jgi:hypothetical protein